MFCSTVTWLIFLLLSFARKSASKTYFAVKNTFELLSHVGNYDRMRAYSHWHFYQNNLSTHPLDLDCDIALISLMIQLKVLYDLRNKQFYSVFEKRFTFDRHDRVWWNCFHVHYSTGSQLIISTSHNIGSHDLHWLSTAPSSPLSSSSEEGSERANANHEQLEWSVSEFSETTPNVKAKASQSIFK